MKDFFTWEDEDKSLYCELSNLICHLNKEYPKIEEDDFDLDDEGNIVNIREHTMNRIFNAYTELGFLLMKYHDEKICQKVVPFRKA